MTRLTLALASILACSCAATPVREAPPATALVTQKCIAAADVPPIPTRAMPKAGSVDQLAAGAGADLLALDAYARAADTLLRQCAAL